MKRPLTRRAAIAALALALLAAAASTDAKPVADAVRRVPIGDSPVEGPADAWVTVVEFTDYQCPFCARVQPTLARLRERYGREIRFVRKDQPLSFHEQALPAARAAGCAGEQGRFWEYSRLLFERQRELDDGVFSAWARDVTGLDAKRFDACLADGRRDARIERDRALAAELGANGTPSFFVNGRILVGAQPLEKFEALVDEELAKAKASGIPAREYYERAVMGAGGP